MNRIKNFFKALFFPHLAIVLFIDLLVIFAFVYSSAILPIFSYIRIIFYVFSLYALILTLCAIPEVVVRISSKKLRKEYIKRLTSDTQFKINIALYGTLAYNALYAAFQLFTGIYYRSAWYLSIAAYYTLLAIMRFSILHYSRAHKAGNDLESEYKRFRFCGIMLLIMNSALSAITFYITWKNQELKHHSATTIIFAVFTFASLALSIINIIRYRKMKSPIFFAVKLIGLVATIVSILALETAIMGRFSAQISDELRQIITGITGIGVLAITIYIGIFMIVRGTKKLKDLKKNQSSENKK